MKKEPKKERRLKRELRLRGFDTKKAAAHESVSVQTVNNWCSGRSIIPACTVVRFKELGIPASALENPGEWV